VDERFEADMRAGYGAGGRDASPTRATRALGLRHAAPLAAV